VDGVPVNTGSNDANTDFRDGQIAPTRFLDIDPNNIESVNILRGLSATTLYGSLGRNGVILVTTKTGSTKKSAERFEGSLSQSYYLIEAILPQFQNKWANGFDGDYGEFFSNWGSLFSNNVAVGPHPYYEHRNTFPEFPEFNDLTGYVPKAQPNNVKDFFNKGVSANTSLQLGFRGENSSINFSYSHLSEDGFIKNNNLTRDNFSLGGTANLTKKLTLQSAFNFVRTDFQTPPTGAGTGSNSTGGPSVFANLYYTPRNMDLMGWPYQNPVTGANVYYRNNNSITNPRWLLDNSRQTSITNRFFSNMSLNYALTDWLKVTYRLGFDTYNEDQSYWLHKGSVGYPTAAAILATGLYRTVAAKNTIVDHSAIATMTKNLTPDLDLTAIVGFNARTDTYSQAGLESSGQVVFGILEHRNFTVATSRDFRGNNLNRVSERTWVGAFFDAGLGYKNFLYLNLTGRNDWASTHEKGNNSLFYPGVSASFIPTAAFEGFATDVLDFLKFRAGYGTSANFVDPYNTRAFFAINPQATVDANGNVVTLALPARLANPNIKPELLSEIEFGTEAHLFDTRLKIDLSVYNRLAKDQILERSLDPSTGYTSTFINAGSISNKGIELAVTGVPVRKTGLVWEITANFTRNRNIVESLPEGSKRIQISGFAGLGSFAEEGKPATAAQRDEAGNFVINENGDYALTSEIQQIADPNPAWLGSVINNFQYKDFNLSFQWDYVHGGQVYSFSAATLVGRGVAKDLEDFDPTLPLLLPGVLEGDGAVNTLPQTTSGVFFNNTIIGSNANDRGVFDGTRIRFRDISLGYNLPKKIVSKAGMKSVNIAITGNNLWFRAVNAPRYSAADFDRTAFGTGNGAGLDFLGGPSARRYGVNLKITF
jgi:TonB-linked SusC/RagA family outer membrane protein